MRSSAQLVLGQGAVDPAAVADRPDDPPILRIDAGGPSSYVSALALDAEGRTLYAAGWDKQIQVWRRAEDSDQFLLDESATIRFPIGPGPFGKVNAMSLSPDEQLLAIGGLFPMRGKSGFQEAGAVSDKSALSEEQQLDRGAIRLINLGTGRARVLRGHSAPVSGLAFIRPAPDKVWLVSIAAAPHTDPTTPTTVALAWDLTPGAAQDLPFARLSLPTLASRPSICAMTAGTIDEAVMITVGDGRVHVWSPRSGQDRPVEWKREYVDTLAPFLDQRRILAGNWTAAQGGNLQWLEWNDREGVRATSRSHKFRKQDDRTIVPRCLTPVATQRSGLFDGVAAVVHLSPSSSRPGGLELRLVRDLDQAQAAEPPPISLGESTGALLPAMAGSGDGRFVAVSYVSATGSEILVCRSKELAADRPVTQRLRARTATVQRIGFLTRDQQLALEIETRTDATRAAERLLLNPREQALRPREAADGWTQFNIDAKRNSPRWSPARRNNRGQLESPSTVQFTDPQKGVRTITVDPTWRVDAIASAPTVIGETVALALQLRGEYWIMIYDLESGAPLRLCAGHTMPVRQLAISGDGRFLASVSDDGVACVWSLESLPQIKGQNGRCPLALRTTADGVRVDGPVAGNQDWRDGDLLLGTARDGKLQPWSTVQQAMRDFWRIRPGESITVQRRREGTDDRAFAIVATQASEEIGPLFSLLVGRPTGAGMEAWRSWIAWTPFGPYQASDPASEKWLGWQLQSSFIENEVAFVPGDQYRGQYRRDGLIREVLEKGHFEDFDFRPVWRPKMRAWFVLENGVAEADDLPRLRSTPRSVRLLVDDLPREIVEQVELWMDGKLLDRFHPQADEVWAASLEGIDWDRNEHQIEVRLTARGVAEPFRTMQSVQYLPEAPLLKTNLAESLVTDKPMVDLDIELQSAGSDEAAEWTIVRHKDGVEEQLAKGLFSGSDRVRQTIQNSQGRSVLEIRGWNRNASDRSRPFEQSVQRIVIDHDANARTVRAEFDAGMSTDRLEPAATSMRKVEISGWLESPVAPSDGSWRIGDREGELVFEPSPVDGKTRFRSREPLQLPAGTHSVQALLRHRTDPLIQIERQVRIVPALPLVRIVEPADGLELVQGRDNLTLSFVAQLDPASKPDPSLEIRLRHNGMVVELPEVDERGQLRCPIPMVPGSNHLELSLANEWNATPRIAASTVLLRVPPVFQTVLAEINDDQRTARLRAVIESGSELTRVDLNGRSLDRSAWQYDEQLRGWRLQVERLALRPGDNPWSLQAWNRDGPALQPGLAELKNVEIRPDPPVVQMIAPIDGQFVTERRGKVNLLIRSRSRLRSVELRNQQASVWRSTELPPQSFENQLYRLELELDIEYMEGVNVLEAIVANESSEATATVRTTLHPPAVVLRIDRLVAIDPLGRDVWHAQPVSGAAPAEQPGLAAASGDLRAIAGEMLVPGSAPEGRIRIEGRVIWSGVIERAKRQRVVVRGWVNGFQQAPVFVDEPAAGAGGDRWQTFVLPAILNESRGNVVEIAAQGAAQATASAGVLRIDCEQPLNNRVLHLVVLGVGVPRGERADLEKRVLAAFGVERPKPESRRLTAPAFSDGFLYGPLADKKITVPEVRGLLQDVVIRIKGLEQTVSSSSAIPRSHVVLFYCEGGIAHRQRGAFELVADDASTGEPADRPRLLDSEMLDNFLARTAGAHVMFLDVVGSGELALQRSGLPLDARAAWLQFTSPSSPRGAAMLLAPRLTSAVEASFSPIEQPLPLGEVDQRLSRKFARGDAAPSGQLREPKFESVVPSGVANLILAKP